MSMNAPSSDEKASTYDDLPYESRFVAATHPDRLATMAMLHGLTPPPPDRCRVLELGCSDGGNLLTIAQSLPGATLVGLELSTRQVAAGRALIDRLGVTNVALHERSLMEVDDALGQFDYIICHGVYSWVSAAVRARILDICARNLAPDGVAYVSYNTYPGWHLRGMVRGMLRFHAAGLPADTDPAQRVSEVRRLLDFMAASATPADSVYAQALKHEAGLIGRSHDTYVFHEHLEADNHPVYYHEFAADARAAGLLPFAPARFDIIEAGLPPEVRQAVSGLADDPVRREQYLDFVVNRTFRQTLLVRAESRPSLEPQSSAVAALRLTALARPETPGLDVRSEAPAGFVSLFGDRLTVGQPLLKAAVFALFERWPRSAGFDELVDETRARLGWQTAATDDDRRAFATFLLQGHMTNLVNLHSLDPPIASSPPARPLAPPLARHAAAAGERVVNLRSCASRLDDLDRLLVPLLDGTRDLPALVEALARKVADGTLPVHHEGQPVRDLARARELLAEPVERSLWKIAGEALLLAV